MGLRSSVQLALAVLLTASISLATTPSEDDKLIRTSERPSVEAETAQEKRMFPEAVQPPSWFGVSVASFKTDFQPVTRIDIRTVVDISQGAGFEVAWEW